MSQTKMLFIMRDVFQVCIIGLEDHDKNLEIWLANIIGGSDFCESCHFSIYQYIVSDESRLLSQNLYSDLQHKRL